MEIDDMFDDDEDRDISLSLAGKVEKQEPVSCSHCDGTGDVHSFDGEWRGECDCGAAQYHMLDRLLRDSLGDDDFAKYSAALEKVASKQPVSSIINWHGMCRTHDGQVFRSDPNPPSNVGTVAPCPECEKLKVNGLVLVTKEDAESYCRILTLLGMEEEGSPIEEVERLLHLREGMVCADCQDTGWLDNRVEGKYPCTCMTEAEPYQLLKAERDRVQADVSRVYMEVTGGLCSKESTPASVVISLFEDYLSKRVNEEVSDIAKERDELAAQVEKLRGALEKIERWSGEFQATGRFWDEPKNTEPMSYSACFGSNGERDFMRGIASEALALPDLSTGILNRVRAEALRKARDIFSGSIAYNFVAADGYSCALDIASELEYMAADMEAVKC